MYKKITLLIVFSMSILLLACASNTKPIAEKKHKPKYAGDMLIFSEILGDQSESNVRMIITDDYLRIDDGTDSEDYVLFDRKTKIIYNIVADDKSIMEMETHDIKLKPNFPLLWSVESQPSHLLMKTDDANAARATHYRLKLNQKECYNLVALDKGMEKPLIAMREYRKALANQLKKHYQAQKGQECYEAINIFSPTTHLNQGFPIREWSVYGYQRFLVNYRKNIIFPKRLFELPKGYGRMKI
ncbi:MAG TPA: hypothetical protein ENJ28_03820 [Gammaproteobacteria bacterium]|nr:hypothetical protein [Gammaproteobacteria bacterium]